MCCLCNYICKWFDVQVFSDIRTVNRRPRLLLLQWYMVSGDINKPTHSSKRVGHVVPGVVVYLSGLSG